MLNSAKSATWKFYFVVIHLWKLTLLSWFQLLLCCPMQMESLIEPNYSTYWSGTMNTHCWKAGNYHVLKCCLNLKIKNTQKLVIFTNDIVLYCQSKSDPVLQFLDFKPNWATLALCWSINKCEPFWWDAIALRLRVVVKKSDICSK